MSDTAEKQFMYKVRAKRLAMMFQGPNEDEQRILDEHQAYLKELADRGVLILAGRTLNADESAFGAVIFRAESEEAAKAIMMGDPAVKRGVLGVQLFPYHVSMIGTLTASVSG